MCRCEVPCAIILTPSLCMCVYAGGLCMGDDYTWRTKGEKSSPTHLKHTLHGHTAAVTCLATSANYSIIASGSEVRLQEVGFKDKALWCSSSRLFQFLPHHPYTFPPHPFMSPPPLPPPPPLHPFIPSSTGQKKISS